MVKHKDMHLIESLRDNVVRFKFQKADGSLRDFLGTRNPELISKRYDDVKNTRTAMEQEAEVLKQLNKDLVVVFDLEENTFKSFKPSRLVKGSWKEFEIVNGSWDEMTPKTRKKIVKDINREIIDLLINNEMDIVFEKASKGGKPGEIREMRATRITSYDSALAVENTEARITQQLTSKRVPVFDIDKGEMRQFNLDRLMKYKLATETTYKDIKRLSNDEKVAQANKMGYKGFDPRTLSAEEIIKALQKNVVRFVFAKKDTNELRVMYATRNASLIEQFYPAKDRKVGSTEEDDKDAIQQQIDVDAIRVFDLDVKGFRTFKTANLVAWDTENDIGSWIEFDIEDDNWYSVLNEGLDINKIYIEGKRKARNIGAEKSVKRAKEVMKNEHENKLRNQVLSDAAEQGLDLAERYEEALTQAKVRAKAIGKLDVQALHVWNRLLKFGAKIQSDFEGKESPNRLLNNVSILKSFNLMIITFNFGRDVFIFHPEFALNAITHRVFVDRTDTLKANFTSPKKSTTQMYFNRLLKVGTGIIRARRGNTQMDTALKERDEQRIKKVMAFANANSEYLNKVVGLSVATTSLKMKTKEIDAKTGNPKEIKQDVIVVADVNNPRTKVLITPNFILNTTTKELLYKRSTQNYITSLASYFNDDNGDNISKFPFSKNQTIYLLNLVLEGFHGASNVRSLEIKDCAYLYRRLSEIGIHISIDKAKGLAKKKYPKVG